RPFQLTTRSIDVAPPWTADESGDPRVRDDFLKPEYALFRGRSEVDPGTGIQRDEVDLGAHSAQQFDHLARVLLGIIDFIEQNILKCQPFPGTQRKFPGGT